MTTKPARASRTIWFNVVTGVSVLLGAIAAQLDRLPIREEVAVWVLFLIAVVQPVLNVVLRLGTHAAIEGTPAEAQAIRAQSRGER